MYIFRLNELLHIVLMKNILFYEFSNMNFGYFELIEMWLINCRYLLIVVVEEQSGAEVDF